MASIPVYSIIYSSYISLHTSTLSPRSYIQFIFLNQPLLWQWINLLSMGSSRMREILISLFFKRSCSYNNIHYNLQISSHNFKSKELPKLICLQETCQSRVECLDQYLTLILHSSLFSSTNIINKDIDNMQSVLSVIEFLPSLTCHVALTIEYLISKNYFGILIL